MPLTEELAEVLNKPISKKKSFSCEICKKEFTRNSSLQTHMNIHLNVKPYVCSICNFRFNANPNLIRHKKNVHNMKFSNNSKAFEIKASSFDQPIQEKKVSVSLSDPIYQKNTKLTTFVSNQRKLPEPIYNVNIAHPVKFKDLAQYETLMNYIESKR